MLVKVSVAVSVPAVTVRPSAETIPEVADGDEGVAYFQLVGVTKGHGRQVGRVVDANQRHVIDGVRSHECRCFALRRAASRDSDRPTVNGRGDDVIIRHHETALGNNHSRALIL
jgi:hypothetical protein